MDSPFPATREELYHVQMEVKHVQAIQNHHADRLLRLEKRQADDAALKSVWQSPFPSVIGGTPQQGPIPNQSSDVFDDFDDEQEQNILGNLNLDADEEPVRRGASRANSVRFDVSAIQGSNWAQSSRNSGDFGPLRPSSGIGSHPIERSLSHKSDGRHSSAGHSVHSIHSVPSGRTSSLGLDTNFMIGGGEQDDDSPLDIPDPPPGLFILGSVPSIIRCWLATNFSHDSLLYAVVCTGSQRSLLDYSLVKELGLLDQMQKDSTSRYTIRLPVYLTEGIITQPISRSSSPAHQLPALTADFEIFGLSRMSVDRKKAIRVFLGSDTLRVHNADILFSQNLMTLYSDDRDKVSVPFVRPEDEKSYKMLRTANIPPEKNELKATAAPFTPTEQLPKVELSSEAVAATLEKEIERTEKVKSTTSTFSPEPLSPFTAIPQSSDDNSIKVSEAPTDTHREHSTSDTSQHQSNSSITQEPTHSDPTTPADPSRRESASGIWGSWRQNSISGSMNGVTEASDQGYQRSTRGGRKMKVLKPSKSIAAAATNSTSSRSSSAARTGASYEPAAPPRSSGEIRRKSLAAGSGLGMENVPPQPLRWERGMSVSKRGGSTDEQQQKAAKLITTVPRSSNPVGGASAFAWMNPANVNSGKKGTTAAE